MPAYNFKLRFAEAIRKGLKRQTIRKERKDGCAQKAGQIAYCYINMRTCQCEKIGEYEIKKVYKIIIDPREICELILIDSNENNIYIRNPKTKADFAKADGFDSWDDFIMFFNRNYGFPFKGYLIQW